MNNYDIRLKGAILYYIPERFITTRPMGQIRIKEVYYILISTYICYTEGYLTMAQLAIYTRPKSTVGGVSPLFLRHGHDLDPLRELTSSIILRSRHPGRLSAVNYIAQVCAGLSTSRHGFHTTKN